MSTSTHILVVGRDESTGAMLSKKLEYEVQTAADEAEARAKIDARRPDVIVVDTTTTSGSNHWDHTTPIVALSTGAQLKEVVARDGVWVCLVKPVQAEVLVGAVERIANFCSRSTL